MPTTIVFITGIAILASFIAGYVVTREHENLLLGVLTVFGDTVISIASAIVFSRYTPAITSDTPPGQDASMLDSVSTLFTEAFTMLAAIAPIILIALGIGGAMQFVKNTSKK